MRLSELVPGLVIAAGRRTVTETEVTEFAARSAHNPERAGGTRSNPDRKSRADTASGWLICAIAEQLVVSTLESSSLTSGPLYIERLSWPGSVHAGDEVELQVEILEKHVSCSGASGFVRWHWRLVSGGGENVLDMVSAVVFENRRPSEKAAGAGSSPIAYKVAKAAAVVGMSRYLLYEAIRNQELRAFRPKPRADLMILAEDLREWVTRHPH